MLRLTPHQAEQVRGLLLDGAGARLRTSRANGGTWRMPGWIAGVHQALVPLEPEVSRQPLEGFPLQRSVHEYNVETAARVLGITRQAVRRLAARGTIPGRRTDDRCRSWLLDADAVDRRADQRRRGVTAFEAELAAANATAATATTAAHRLRVRQSLVAAGMPAERATEDLATSLLDVEVGSDDQALQASVERVKANAPGLFSNANSPAPPAGGAVRPGEVGRARATARARRPGR